MIQYLTDALNETEAIHPHSPSNHEREDSDADSNIMHINSAQFDQIIDIQPRLRQLSKISLFE